MASAPEDGWLMDTPPRRAPRRGVTSPSQPSPGSPDSGYASFDEYNDYGSPRSKLQSSGNCGLDGQHTSQIQRDSRRTFSNDRQRCCSFSGSGVTREDGAGARDNDASKTWFINSIGNLPAQLPRVKVPKCAPSLAPDRFVALRTHQSMHERYRTTKPLSSLSNVERISRGGFIGCDPFLPRPRQSSSLTARFCPLEETQGMLRRGNPF